MQRPPETVAPRRFLTGEKPKWYPGYGITVGTVTVEVTRKRVKRFNLHVRTDGSAAMSIPWHTSRQAAQAFLESRAEWLEETVERAKRRRSQEAADGLVPLWGKLVELPEGHGVEEFYHDELERALPEVISVYEEACGLHASLWRLKDMSTRWGSCNPSTRSISINIRLAAYPRTCLEYVVAHELTHIAEPSHNDRFHLLVSLAYPNEAHARALLRHDPRELAEGKA